MACNSGALPAWQYRAVAALLDSPGVAIVATLRYGAPPAGRPGWLWRRFFASRVAPRSRALAVVDRGEQLHGVLHIEVEDAPDPILHALDLDAVVDLDGVVPAATCSARYGVWTLVDEATGVPVGCQTGFWEILTGAATTSVVLQRAFADGRLEGLVSAAMRTRRHSYLHTLDDALFAAADLLSQLSRIIGSSSEGERRDVRESTDRGVPPLTSRATARLIVTLAWTFLRAQVDAVVWSPQWNVGVVDAPIEKFLEPDFHPVVRWLPAEGRATFRADPFGRMGSTLTMLVETFDYATGVGAISALDEHGTTLEEGPVLRLDGHASYPYLVASGGEVYCIPQMDAATGIRAFRASEYPTLWEDAGVLIEGVQARDATVFQYEATWWAAFTDAVAGPFTHLHLWWSDTLLGGWRPHAANPVKIDARSARPAGTPFVVDGALYRPAQDCSRAYGGAIAICQVDRLTPTDFSERVVRVIGAFPGNYGRGTHTLSSAGSRTLVDGKRSVFSLAGSRAALRSRLSR